MAVQPVGKTRPTNLFARFGANRKGVSALEFALVAPVLILTYFGVGELCEALMAARRVSHAASAVGDLTAQASSVAASDVSDIFAAATDILTPFPTTPLKLRLTSVTANSNAVPKVDWSCAQGGLSANAVGATYSGLPTGLIVLPGDSVIVAESQYKWTPPATYILPNGLTLSDIFYLKPRKSSTVAGPASC